MVQFKFFDVFEEVNGQLRTTRPISIGGVTIGVGVVFGRGVTFSGVDIFEYFGRPIEADEVDNVLIIKGFY